LDRQTKILYADASQVTFTYDAVGNRLSLVDIQGTTTYAYDNLYRPTNINSPNGSLQYTYNAINRLSVTSPAGITSYAYDASNKMVQVTDWEGQITIYDYDDAGRLTTTLLPNGVLTTNTYDIANRLTNITHKKDSTVLESFSYTLDPVGNRLSMTDGDGTTNYTYDALDRLLTVSYPTGTPSTVSYTYDPMGNRLSMTEDGSTTTYVYDEADRLLSKTKGTETTLYTLDNDGNLLTKGDQTFTWNKDGKLATWTDGTNSSSYTYNGAGVRVTQTVNGTPTNYLQDIGSGMAVVLREDKGGDIRDYVYGLDLISQQDSTSTNYLLADGLGSTRLLTDEIGIVTGRYIYDVFGGERSYSGADQTDYTFAGEQMDKTSGLQYLRARYFDPEEGRFISVDPIPGSNTLTQTLHHYVYVENNPTNLIDPTGTSSQDNYNKGETLGTNTSNLNDEPYWQLPGYYTAVKNVSDISQMKVNGESFVNIPKSMISLYGKTSGFWKFFNIANKTIKYIDGLLSITETNQKVNYNQRTGAYGKSKEAQEANLGKNVKIMRVWEVATSWIPKKFTIFGSQMKRTKTFSNFTDNYAKREGAAIDMAVIDPSKDPEGFLDAYDRDNSAFR